MLVRRAFAVHDVRPDHGGTVESCSRRMGPGTRWLAGLRAPGPRSTSSDRSAGRSRCPQEPVPVPAGRRGLRQRAAVRPRGPLADRGCRWTTCSAPQRGPGVRRADRQAVRAQRHGDHRGRLARAPAGRSPPCWSRSSARRARSDLRLRAGAGAAGRGRAGRPGTPSRCRSSVDVPMACGIGVCMSCVLPVTGTTGSPGSSARAWTARSSAATWSGGTTWARSRSTRSEPPAGDAAPTPTPDRAPAPTARDRAAEDRAAPTPWAGTADPCRRCRARLGQAGAAESRASPRRAARAPAVSWPSSSTSPGSGRSSPNRS